MLPTKIVRGPFPPAFKCICPNQSNLKLWSVQSRPLSVAVHLREGKSLLATTRRFSVFAYLDEQLPATCRLRADGWLRSPEPRPTLRTTQHRQSRFGRGAIAPRCAHSRTPRPHC